MDDKISPEERLFKVIRGTKRSPVETPIRRNKVFFSLEGMKLALGSFISRFKHSPANHKVTYRAASVVLPVKLQNIDFKKIITFLSVILAVLVLLTAYYAIKKPNLSKITDAVFDGGYQARSLKSTDAFQPLTFYAEQAKKRDIFHPATNVIKSFSSSNLQKDLGLTGIYHPVGKPAEAMIEDKAAKKTYFLKEGEEIKGMKVKTILKDRVILQFGDEEMELL
jgi:hypothetical protein